jgi:hypothetical protein
MPLGGTVTSGGFSSTLIPFIKLETIDARESN